VPLFGDHRGTTVDSGAPHRDLPDMRDGLISRARIVPRCLHALLKAHGGRYVPTGRLYERVVENNDMHAEEM